MLQASISKNDKLAKWLIGIFSVVVFTVVVLLSKFKLEVDLGFDVHIFAKANAVITCFISAFFGVLYCPSFTRWRSKVWRYQS
jgi:putative membrane protein